MSISADTLRGYTDTIILTQLAAKDSYGYEINKQVQQRTGGKYELKEATLYTAFKRLGQNGLITSYWGEEGAGARRRYYKITEEGRKQWEERIQEWQEIRSLLDALLTLEDGQEKTEQTEVEHEPD
ncbi:MAG: PadR family transcriptional regulator [Eubacteriales bacterium]|nr:PadR family transcriptional regulator [Eubacteriales bacterium]